MALSAALDGTGMHQGPPLLVPDPTKSNPPPEPIGTVMVLDPDTGESLTSGTVLGGEPPADAILQLPGAVQDVALPPPYR